MQELPPDVINRALREETEDDARAIVHHVKGLR